MDHLIGNCNIRLFRPKAFTLLVISDRVMLLESGRTKMNTCVLLSTSINNMFIRMMDITAPKHVFSFNLSANNSKINTWLTTFSQIFIQESTQFVILIIINKVAHMVGLVMHRTLTLIPLETS